MEKALDSDTASTTATLTSQLEQVFTQQPELLGLGIGALAKRLCTSRRTLQRRLGEEGMTFSAVEARVRARLAEQLLAEPKLSIEQVSERLGFTDRRSFTQAFTRWFGQPPSQMRRGLSFYAARVEGRGAPALERRAEPSVASTGATPQSGSLMVTLAS